MENTYGNEGSGQRIFVRADEVDSGTSIPSPNTQLPLSALALPSASAPAGNRPKAPPRPLLRREGSAAPPPPPSHPPPVPPAHMPPDPTDSLSLPQLKALVSQFPPKPDQTAYAFQYSDTEGFADEIEEWFRYTEQDQKMILSSRDAFEQGWKSWCQTRPSNVKEKDIEWMTADQLTQRRFVKDIVKGCDTADSSQRVRLLECLAYILFGAWSLTSGLERQDGGDEMHSLNKPQRDDWNTVQVTWMYRGAESLAGTDGGVPLKWLYENLRTLATRPSKQPSALVADKNDGSFMSDADGPVEKYETRLTLTCLYLLIESGRAQKGSKAAKNIRRRLQELSPNFLVFLVGIISKFRWDEERSLPLGQMFQLLWKSMLFLLGNITGDYEYVKSVLQPRPPPLSSGTSHPILTASPLDYHLFRQEITSKYPAYNPPLPLIPLEIDNRSMLPPLPYSHKQDGNAPITSTAASVSAESILHQPVHIATPAPSPPPSPIGPGGEAGKKQNYQTNQNFPFLYPPLDDSSNMIGGSGSTAFQDSMVGRRWDGSDIPASIIEAGELFASRMRMTRALRQLWRERDLFMKYDRGWKASKPTMANGSVDKADHNSMESQHLITDEDQKKIDADKELKDRFRTVDDFFHFALPDLQSLVIVMMKVMLRNVQEIALQNGGIPDNNTAGGLSRTKSNMNMAQNQSLPMPSAAPHPGDMSVEDLEAVRSRETCQKAISGTIFVMLKWLKISHVLKFEYMTQLLLDSNFLQLTLKHFAHQNLEDLVAIKYEREDLGFFHFCHLNSDHPPLSPASPQPDSDSNSDDEAVPPPIPRHKRSPTSPAIDAAPASPTKLRPVATIASPPRSSTSPLPMNHPEPPLNLSPTQTRAPTVDELGNPTSVHPQSPITDFSWRQLQTSIHLLRILHRLTHRKPHRVLLLVQFKSSTILRRLLRVPDSVLRLYTLKLFKSQVPYCGRKWRQSNMRVITAIYLHVRPELRDEWLAGLHDATAMGGAGGAATGGAGGGGQGQDGGEVDEAVPLEWALRGLTFWWMKRAYPDTMRLKLKNDTKPDETPVTSHVKDETEGAEEATAIADWAEGGGQEIEEEERDFFQRELDAMGWGVAALGLGGAGEDVEFGEEAPGVGGATGENVGGPAKVGERRPVANGVVQQQLPLGETRAVNGDIID